VLGGQIAQDPDHRRAAEQTGLERADSAVGKYPAALILDLLGPLRREPTDATGILGGQTADNAADVNAGRAGGLGIGRNASPTARIMSADTEKDAMEIIGCHRIRSAMDKSPPGGRGAHLRNDPGIVSRLIRCPATSREAGPAPGVVGRGCRGISQVNFLQAISIRKTCP